MGIFLNLQYRANYVSRFIRCAKILGIPITFRLLKTAYIGANPKIFCDSSGDYCFNKLTVAYLDKPTGVKNTDKRDKFSLSDYDIKMLAINYRLLSGTGLNILKYPPCLSYSSKRRLNMYLYKLKAFG